MAQPNITCMKCYTTEKPKRVLGGRTAITALLCVGGIVAFIGFGVWLTQEANANRISPHTRLGFPELMVFIAPAFIYQISRFFNPRSVCAGCESSDVVPADSPRGREIQEKHA